MIDNPVSKAKIRCLDQGGAAALRGAVLALLREGPGGRVLALPWARTFEKMSTSRSIFSLAKRREAAASEMTASEDAPCARASRGRAWDEGKGRQRRRTGQEHRFDLSRRHLLKSTPLVGAGVMGRALIGIRIERLGGSGGLPCRMVAGARAAAGGRQGGRRRASRDQLWYLDTGGDGIPVVLMHSGLQGAPGFAYQLPVFAQREQGDRLFAARLQPLGSGRQGQSRHRLGGSGATS